MMRLVHISVFSVRQIEPNDVITPRALHAVRAAWRLVYGANLVHCGATGLPPSGPLFLRGHYRASKMNDLGIASKHFTLSEARTADCDDVLAAILAADHEHLIW